MMSLCAIQSNDWQITTPINHLVNHKSGVQTANYFTVFGCCVNLIYSKLDWVCQNFILGLCWTTQSCVSLYFCEFYRWIQRKSRMKSFTWIRLGLNLVQQDGEAKISMAIALQSMSQDSMGVTSNFVLGQHHDNMGPDNTYWFLKHFCTDCTVLSQ